jgi:hypothetical protein
MSLWQKFQRGAPYHASFVASVRHAWLALATLGVGIAVATPLSLTLGILGYGLGIIFLPDLRSLRAEYDSRRLAEIDNRNREESSLKEKVREGLLRKLTPATRARWQKFSVTCEELQAKFVEGASESLMQDDSLAKVADSHLLLLAMDADIRGYLASAESAVILQQRTTEVQAEVEKLHTRTGLSDVEQRLVLSKEETLKNLVQQAGQNKRMQLNLDLARSEIERLESQISYLKAEMIANPAGQLSNRLSDTLIQVEASQRVLQEGGMVNAPDLTTLLGENA